VLNGKHSPVARLPHSRTHLGSVTTHRFTSLRELAAKTHVRRDA